MLDRYIIPIPDGYEGYRWKLLGAPRWIKLVLGFCGGRVTNFFAIMGKNINIHGRDWYRYILFMFSHGFIVHLLVNVVSLKLIGDFVEEKIGSIMTLFLFLFSGIIQGVATEPVYLLLDKSFDSDSFVACGASGGIMGLIGAGLIICLYSEQKFKSISVMKRIILAMYGIIFTYLANGKIISMTMVAHNIGMAVGIIAMIALMKLTKKND